jgi:hypothetical protein
VPFDAIFIHAIVTYPSDWGKADQSTIKMLNPGLFSNCTDITFNHTIAAFFSSDRSTNMAILVEDIPLNTTLDKYVESELELIRRCTPQFMDLNTIRSRNISPSGNCAQD